MDKQEVAAIRDAVMDALAPTISKMIDAALTPALNSLSQQLSESNTKRAEDVRYLEARIDTLANRALPTPEVPPATLASMRDSIASSIAPTVNSQITDAVTQLRLLSDQYAAALAEKQSLATAGLLSRVDDISGQLDKLQRMDRYQVTKRALVKFLEQTDG